MPGAQAVHALQVVALVSVENVPPSQVVQVRSVVAEPVDSTNCPARHSVQVVQALAGFWSWSQVSSSHVTEGASAPAQKVPGSQGVHSGSVWAVPGVISVVPAGHWSWGTHWAESGVIE